MDIGELANAVQAIRRTFELRTSLRSDNGSATGDKLERAYDFAVLRAVVESGMAGDELPSGASARTLATPVEQLLERFTDGSAGGSAAGGPQVADLFSLRAEFCTVVRGRTGESLEFRQQCCTAGADERLPSPSREMPSAIAPITGRFRNRVVRDLVLSLSIGSAAGYAFWTLYHQPAINKYKAYDAYATEEIRKAHQGFAK
ncbi:hypothetical protein HK405_004425 [Cladochytrium tenue]|nr:hypothetical protein HK405_004425 [Cladochytrium tenue]